MKRICLLPVLVFLVSSCGNSDANSPSSNLNIQTPSVVSVGTETRTPIPALTSTPTLVPSSGLAVGPVIPDTALLFDQDFESDTTESAISAIPKWKLDVDATGNHILCNQKDNSALSVNFGSDAWSNYAVEMRVKSVHLADSEQYFSLFARVDPSSSGYYATISFVNQMEDLQYGPQPYFGFGNQKLNWISNDVWYLMRLEVAGTSIRSYIDNSLVEASDDSHSDHGTAAFTVQPHMQICVDDIRVWGLNAKAEVVDVQQPGSIPDATLGVLPVVYPEVWGNEDPGGVLSYEFKTNCGGDYTDLEACFLWDLTDVTVKTPGGTIFQLRKDFNINQYSGEVTRRWVLYGPPNSGLPGKGIYTFTYYKNDQVMLVQQVRYTQHVVTPVTNITAVQNGNSLSVSWQPPQDAPGLSCKVFVSRNSSVGFIYSHPVPCDSGQVILSDLSLLVPGERYEIGVAAGGAGGSSGTEIFRIVWKAP